MSCVGRRQGHRGLVPASEVAARSSSGNHKNDTCGRPPVKEVLVLDRCESQCRYSMPILVALPTGLAWGTDKSTVL